MDKSWLKVGQLDKNQTRLNQNWIKIGLKLNQTEPKKRPKTKRNQQPKIDKSRPKRPKMV